MKTRLAALLAAGLAVWPVAAQQPAEADALWHMFETPPDDARPMVRWWWFGPAVTAAEIDREIAAMKAGGFGGFEVQPTYPLAPDGAPSDLKNLPYLSPPFLTALRHAGDTARASGMRFDVTLGSGWPFGGPHVSVTQAAADVWMVQVAIPARATRVPLAPLGPGERRLAAFVDGARVALGDDGIALRPTASPRTALLFVAGRTGQQVKRAAVGAEGFVIDHVSAAAVTNHLQAVGDRLLSAFAGGPAPYAMFSDSLEAYGSSWTDDLPTEFRRRRGYDLLDHLPALFTDGPESAGVRYDWARTLSELVDERYLRPITAWAHAHGTRFRAQVYGFPPPTLSSNALVDLPEGEGADWRQFTSSRWASSAAHLYGRPVVSSETWTWLHSPAWAATPLDMKVEADRHFLQGINQLVGHGWPYSPPGIAEPGWAFYAAAALNDHNPWFAAMPAVTRYLQRVSAMLRQGVPDSGVAVYLPTEDAFAGMQPARASANEAIRARLGPDLVGQVLDAGQTFDFIDAQAILAGKLTARVLVLPELTRIDPAAYSAIAAWVRRGGMVVATGHAPSVGGGLREGPTASRAVTALSGSLLRGGRGRIVATAELATTLRGLMTPAMPLAAPDPAIGIVHRRLPNADIYFVANTAPRSIDTSARFSGDNGRGQWWDPLTGERAAAGVGPIALRLAPYQSKLLVFARGGAAPEEPGAAQPSLDLSTGWRTQALSSSAQPPQPGRSWTDLPELAHYSGAVRYSRRFVLPATRSPRERLLVDFGKDAATPQNPENRPRAALLAPVRDAAVVRVNGVLAGTVWAPPWRLDITRLVRPGDNRIEVTAMNTALAELSGRPPRDHRLLTMRYGERFQDQDTAANTPTPAGLLGHIRLFRQPVARSAPANGQPEDQP